MTSNKLYIHKAYNLITFDVCIYTYETNTTIKIEDRPINTNLLMPFYNPSLIFP